ncbi:MAG: ATP synthase F1 subunit gamma [Phycisphaerales bacterium]|nr:ATP synthase F1 subunit gamma [Phycisphaerales bacterium]
MAKARELKKRQKAVGNIKRITRTMQMIATSKFARAQGRATQSKPYSEGIFELVTELARRAGNIDHPLVSGPSGGVPKTAKPLVLVVTSDRGLCGPYNGSIIRTAMRHLREIGFDNCIVEVAGRKGLGVFKFNGITIGRHVQVGDNPTVEDVHHLANDYMQRFTAGEVSAVHVIFMNFISVSRQKPEVLQLLPLKPPASDDAGEAKGPAVEYDFSPPAPQLLADLLPVTVRTTLFQAFLDAVVSEHIARMVAMKAATDNATKMGKDLSRRFNRARQTQITTELTEIISGAAALE